MGELGWIEGRTVAFEYRFAEGRTDRAAEVAAEFVRMATICGFREYVEALMSYSPNLPALFRRAGEFVDKIL